MKKLDRDPGTYNMTFSLILIEVTTMCIIGMHEMIPGRNCSDGRECFLINYGQILTFRCGVDYN
jgi:hypothetical protein